MDLCSDGHEEICFEGRYCPACTLREEKDDEIEDLNKELSSLQKERDSLEDEVISLESKLGES